VHVWAHDKREQFRLAPQADQFVNEVPVVPFHFGLHFGLRFGLVHETNAAQPDLTRGSRRRGLQRKPFA